MPYMGKFGVVVYFLSRNLFDYCLISTSPEDRISDISIMYMSTNLNTVCVSSVLKMINCILCVA